MVELMSFIGYLNFKNIPFKLLYSWKKKFDVEDKGLVRCNIFLTSDFVLHFQLSHGGPKERTTVKSSDTAVSEN